jgi:uncharacterized membrane protein YqjE
MADGVNGGPSRPASEQSTAELIQRATEQVSKLVRDELALARIELAQKGKHAGIGVGLFGGGGVMAVFGLGTLIATAILLLALAIPAWSAALLVTVALFVLAGILALIGRKQVRRAVPPVPTDAAEEVRRDVEVVTTAVRDRGRP